MPKIKRESRQFIVINEDKLINEVQIRPILYDKALKGYRKPAIRESAWQEVAVHLESTVEECKKRWRSLRDAFMKQHKLFSRGDTNMKKRWIFYEQMAFLGPYIDAEEKYIAGDEYIETINADGDLVDESCQKLTNQRIVCITTDDTEYRHQIEIDDYNEDQLEVDALDTTSYERIPTTKSSDKSQKNVFYLSAANSSTSTGSSNLEQNQSSSQNSKYSSSSQAGSTQNDPDERFLLSCAPILKRLPTKKNALARLKIQQLLFDIEFDEYTE